MHIAGRPPRGTGKPTEGVRTLHGDPKKAIVKLAWPMMVAMSAQTIYNVVDAIWVSGLGADALAAVGLFFPFFFMSMAIATGIGMGGSAAVSRFIGAKDKEGTDEVASHAIVLMVISALVFTFPFLVFARPMFLALGAGGTIEKTVAYSQVMFGGTIIVFFSNIALALLRGEGDAKRPMYAMLSGSILNIVLDPIFIYTLGLGVAGAAWATLISMGLTSAILFNWLFLRKDTYMDFRFRGFRFRRAVLTDIFRVGLPASVQHVSMSFMMVIMNLIIVVIGGTDGIAVFTTGWRVAMMANLPILGMSTAVVAVTGAAFGMRDYDRLKTAFMYAVKLGIVIEVIMVVLAFALAPQIAYVFTTSEGAIHLRGDLITFLRTMCFFLPFVPMGMLSSAMFQGTGKGIYALIATLIRTLILVVPITYLFGIVMLGTLQGIWIGLVLANSLGSFVAFGGACYYISGLRKREAVSGRGKVLAEEE